MLHESHGRLNYLLRGFAFLALLFICMHYLLAANAAAALLLLLLMSVLLMCWSSNILANRFCPLGTQINYEYFLPFTVIDEITNQRREVLYIFSLA